MLFCFAQAVGFCGMLLAFVSFQQNRKEQIAFLQMLASAVWTLHFGLLCAWAGMAMNAIGIARGFVFSRKGKPWASGRFWPYLFSGLSVVACLLTWQSWISLLPTAAMVISCFGLWAERPCTVRRLNLPGSLLWLLYNLLCRSFAGIVTECFNTASILFAMLRFDREKNCRT